MKEITLIADTSDMILMIPAAIEAIDSGAMTEDEALDVLVSFVTVREGSD